MVGFRIGRIGRIFAPGYGCCGRCKTPWKFVEKHVTKHSDSGGCFPLCEKCWVGLTVEQRMPHYRHLYFTIWGGHDRVPWVDIEHAVQSGG